MTHPLYYNRYHTTPADPRRQATSYVVPLYPKRFALAASHHKSGRLQRLPISLTRIAVVPFWPTNQQQFHEQLLPSRIAWSLSYVISFHRASHGSQILICLCGFRNSHNLPIRSATGQIGHLLLYWPPELGSRIIIT